MPAYPDLKELIAHLVPAVVTRSRPPVLIQPLTAVRPLAGDWIIPRGGEPADPPIGPDEYLRTVREAIMRIAACRGVLRRATGRQGRVHLGAGHPGQVSD